MLAVSVLMPCYNAAQTLEDTLESLKKQTLANLEIISVDDGSSDETLQILQAGARGDRRTRVLSQPNLGIIPALDADDLAYPEQLSLQVDFLDRHPGVCVAGCQVKGFPPQNLRQGFQVYIRWLNSLTSDAVIIWGAGIMGRRLRRRQVQASYSQGGLK